MRLEGLNWNPNRSPGGDPGRVRSPEGAPRRDVGSASPRASTRRAARAHRPGRGRLRLRAETPSVLHMSKRQDGSKVNPEAASAANPGASATASRPSKRPVGTRAKAAGALASAPPEGSLARLTAQAQRFEPLTWLAAHERLWVNAGVLAGIGASLLSALGQRRAAKTLGHLCPALLLGGIYSRLSEAKAASRPAKSPRS